MRKMLAPIISVVIPAYNEKIHIYDCVTSLLNQSYKKIEIVVVDDGSTDGTIQQIKHLPIKIIQNNHQGPAKSRNLGVRNSSGEIIVFADADMTFPPDYVEKLVDPILTKNAIGTYTNQEEVSNWDNSIARFWNYADNNFSRSRVVSPFLDTKDFRSIQKKYFLSVGGFDDIGYTDTYTLSQKLGVLPTLVEDAKCSHSNPTTLREVFIHSAWIGRRKTRYGSIGQLGNILRYSLPVSIIKGLFISLKTHEFMFIPFLVIRDFGFTFGILTNMLFNQKNK